MDRKSPILVVGAGFAGAVITRELANSNHFSVTVIDRRDHIAGNAYDPVCRQTGTQYHQYGPHIFHTNSKKIVDYLSQYTQWVDYKHKVMAYVEGVGQVPMPINRTTLNQLYGERLESEQDIKQFLAKVRIPVDKPRNALEHLYGIYGKELTELFFARYSRKMWGLGLEEMPASVVERIPVRYDDSPYYFNDKYQIMPAHGYHPLFEKLLDHPEITILLSTAFDKTMEAEYDHCFNSMPIDEYFDYCFGELPYRSIKFEHGLQEPFEFQVPTVNFTDTGMYTRVTNWQLYPGTICGERRKYTNEIPCSYVENNMERYYPVKTVDGKPQDIYRQYTRKATKLHKITFIGRCGQYIYYDMHQVVANSLKIAEEFLRNRS